MSSPGPTAPSRIQRALFTSQEIAKALAFRTGLLRVRHPFNVDPVGIYHFMNEIVRCERDGVPGHIVEVGVARGKTTAFMCRFLNNIASERLYYCVDTFGGFTGADVEYETRHRHKNAHAYRAFAYNDRATWEHTVVTQENVARIRVIEGDIKQVPLPDCRFAVALVDVDLYQPTIAGIERFLARMSPGGVILVDDVTPNQTEIYDGATDAFLAICAKLDLRHEFVAPSIGIIRAN